MTQVRIRVAPGAPQVLVVRATGQGLLWIDGNGRPSDADAVVPDPVRFFADCAQGGFFPATSVRVDESRFESRTCEQVWTLAVESLAPGALRVLVHLLLARGLDALDIQTRARDVAPMIEAMPPEYAPAPPSSGFRVERGKEATEGRLLRVELTRPPTDGELGELYVLLEAWVDLLLLGGFPADGRSRARSGVVPAFAVLLEPAVVEQEFSSFYCHEDAFHAVLQAITRWHTRCPIVRQVAIN